MNPNLPLRSAHTVEQKRTLFFSFFINRLSVNHVTGSIRKSPVMLAVLLFCVMFSFAQTTYDFTTNATLSYGTGGFGIWNTQADITIGGVAYKLTAGGNGSFTNQATGGSGNSKCLQKEGSGGDEFILQRADGQPFQFYGFWVKHQSMNNYAQFYSLPPFYTITYNKSGGGTETYNDNTAMQGSTAPGNFTTSSQTFTKDIAVTSVAISFKAIMYYWIDDIKVGPVTAAGPGISVHPSNKIVCAGSNTTFSVTASNATGYQWQVNSGSGYTSIVNGAPYSGATTASLTVTGATAGMNGYFYRCVASDGSTNVNSNGATLTVSSVTASTSQVNVSCNGGSNGSATVVPGGGTSPYSYSWSPSGGTGATASGLAAGTYTVTITDNNSCQTTRSVTINQPTALTATASKTNVSCNGGSNGTAGVVASGSAGSYSYSWSPSGGTGATATGLSAGNYTVTITDANSCQATRNFTITQPATLTATATPASQTICSGEQTNIALSSSPSGAGFSWTVSAISGNVTGASASAGPSIQQTLTGNGVVKYTITPDNGTCTGSPVSVTVTVNSLPAIDMHPSDRSVFDEDNASFSIEAAHASSYQWQVDKGSGFADISNDAHYNGVTTATLSIINAQGNMNGYRYRCVASGNCSPVVSNSALLLVTVRTSQIISFAATDEKVYGSPDFVPQAGSDAGLEVIFTSSDESIASIVDGRIHIKKAGQVTITASQPGNNSYKPAVPVQQTLTIAKKQISVSMLAVPVISKIYDGNANAALDAANYSLEYVVEGDDVTVSGNAVYENSNAGTDKTIAVSNLTLGGADKDNYTLSDNEAFVTGNISRKTVEVALHSYPLISKTYDGSNNAVLLPEQYSLDGLIGEDEVSVSAGSVLYEDKNKGIDKVITATGFILSGAEKDNYMLSNTAATTRGNIIAKSITVWLAEAPVVSKVYDGGVEAIIPAQKYQLMGIEDGDDVTVAATAVYSDRNAGSDKIIHVNSFELAGADKSNYDLTTLTATTTGSIAKATITVSLQSAAIIGKQYDGTTDAVLSEANYVAAGIIGEDEVILNYPVTGHYDNKHGGTGKTVTVTGVTMSGTDADNYQLAGNGVSGSVGIITRKPVTVTAQAQTRQYGSPDPELTYMVDDILEGDELQGTLSREEGKNVGTYTITAGTLAGGDDYEITDFTSSELTITPASLIIKAEDKVRSQGTVNPALTFSYEGLVEGDTPASLETLPVAATGATKGSPIGYYDIEVSGASSSNYTISYQKGKLTVKPSLSEKYSLKVWSSSPDVLQVRIYSDVPQKAAIILYTEAGQQVFMQQKQLQAGINSYSIYVGNLSRSTYILGVAAEKFRDAEKVQVK
ncbi:MAG: hypothetical protein KF746_23605 [Chitinophagaceae bacterium]|nr:hypothetical protein [Chitinophagaceae bacterium]